MDELELELDQIKYELESGLDQSFTRTQETANYQKNTDVVEWEAIREECRSGGAMDDRCNIVAASLGTGKLDVVAKRLVCGCLLVPVDSGEVVL